MTRASVGSTVQNLISQNKRQLGWFVLGANDFTRSRKLGLEHTIGHILYLSSQRNENGYEITSQNYFAEAGHVENSVGRSSLSEARQKLHWSAFEYLLSRVNADHGLGLKKVLWHGLVVKAIDGTFLTLPASQEVLSSFPRRVSACTQTHYPKGIFVTAMNVFTGQPTQAAIDCYKGSERSLLKELLKDFSRGDVLLLDRGFAGMEYFTAMHERGLYFVARLCTSGNNVRKEVLDLLKYKKRSATVDLKGKVDGEEKCVRVRLLRSWVDRKGEPIVLISNLLGRETYKNREIIDLYMKRWRIETLYYRAKELLHIESFHAKTLNGVLQEVFANLVVLAITALLARAAQRGMPEARASPNFKAASEAVRRHFHIFIIIKKAQKGGAIEEILKEIAAITCTKQVGRKNPRISKQPHTNWVGGQKNRLQDKYKRREKMRSRAAA